MKRIKDSIPWKNITRRPKKSALLIALVALLTFAVCGGTLLILSLQNGLRSLSDRMGADIMVVPYQATTKSDIDAENIVMLGNMGYFYMDSALYDNIAHREGVGQCSAQFFLSTVSSSCCSVPVQIVGFDPATDFTISPWIKSSYGKELRDMEIVVGNDLNAFVGDTLQFYGTDVTVAAKLDKTGTNLDTAVYTNAATIKKLIAASVELGLNTFRDVNPDRVVSSVLVNAADGYNVEEVLNDINIHVRKVKAYRTAGMMEGITTSLAGVSFVIRLMSIAVWLLCFVILIIVFTMSANERKKEFALLRALGASVKKTSRIMAAETMLLSVAGAVIGAVCACVLIAAFSGGIENALALPFLLPPGRVMALCALLSAGLGIVCGMGSAARVVKASGHTDAGLILREA